MPTGEAESHERAGAEERVGARSASSGRYVNVPGTTAIYSELKTGSASADGARIQRSANVGENLRLRRARVVSADRHLRCELAQCTSPRCRSIP